LKLVQLHTVSKKPLNHKMC